MKILVLVTLSDKNKYIVVSKAEYKDKVYVCLVDIINNQHIKHCSVDDNEVVEEPKENLNEILLLKLAKSSIKIDFQSLMNN